MVSSPLAVAEDALTPSSPHTFSLFSLPTGAPGAHPPAPASCPLPAHRCPYRLVALGWDSCCRMRLNCLFIILRVRRRPGEPFFFFPHSAVPAQHPWLTLGMGHPRPPGLPGATAPRAVAQAPLSLLAPSSFPRSPFRSLLVPSLGPPWGCPACFLFPSRGLLFSLAPSLLLSFLPPPPPPPPAAPRCGSGESSSELLLRSVFLSPPHKYK